MDNSVAQTVDIMVGKMMRLIRKSKKKTLAELEDESISRSTISKIEKGKINAGNLTKYLDRLEVKENELPQFAEKALLEQEKMEYKTIRLVHKAYLSHPDDFLFTINHIASRSKYNNPFYSLFNFLKGRTISYKNLDRAKEVLLDVIEATRKNEYQLEYNIRAMAYCEIARIEYSYGKSEQALYYNQKGIEEVNFDELDKSDIHHILQVNHAIYLESLGRDEEAAAILNGLFGEIKEIDIFDIRLQMFYVRSKLLVKSKSFSDAHRFAWQGLELARKNHQQYLDRAAMLLTNLGDIETYREDYEAAEDFYNMALDIKKRLPRHKEYLFIDTHYNLGNLHLKLSGWKDAKKQFNYSLALSKKHKDNLTYIRSMTGIGHLYLQQGQHAMAEERLQDALEIAKKCNIDEQQQSIYLELAGCYEELNEEKFQYYLKQYFKLQKRKGVMDHGRSNQTIVNFIRNTPQ